MLRKETSLTAARKLFNEFILQFGFPSRIHHNRGKAFNSELFKELHHLAGMNMSNTTPYHPMGNGSAEGLNRTSLNMLKSIPENENKNWKDHLPKLIFAYNSTVNKTTGFSLFELMFGRKTRFLIHCIMPLETEKQQQNIRQVCSRLNSDPDCKPEYSESWGFKQEEV